jgi:cellulose synthase/poly-beta-1,6-N-acetylglucosamine synthase-like glycosyltransferase
MLIIILAVSIIYCTGLILYSIGSRRIDQQNISGQPFISIIISARNEEKNIKSCIESIINTDYPEDKHEIIIADDYSTDKTSEIITSFTSKYKNIHSFQPEPDKDNLKGKMNAISQAIDRSSGEIIFITDADCIVPRTWISNTLKYYDSLTGLVCGITYTNYDSIFHGIQSLDWIYHLFIAVGCSGFNIPYSCVGNNMSFRRKAYDETGGYKNLGFSFTEDVKLLQAISTKTNWKCKFPVQKENLVLTMANDSIKQMIHQKKRWASRNRFETGGKKSPYPVLFLMSISSLIYPLIFLTPFLITNIYIILLPLLIKIISDFLFLITPLKRLHLLKLFKFFPAFEFYFIIYVPILPILLLFDKKFIWKGRIFNN